jgi:hypothetical protein
MKFHTRVLTSGQSLTIAALDNVLQISIKTSSSGSGTFIGSGSFQGTPSQSQTLGASDGLSLFSQNPQSPLEGITITCVSGNVNVIIGQT